MNHSITPYKLFCADEQRLILKTRPDISDEELRRLLRSRWDSYPLEERFVYVQLYESMKESLIEEELRRFIQQGERNDGPP